MEKVRGLGFISLGLIKSYAIGHNMSTNLFVNDSFDRLELNWLIR